MAAVDFLAVGVLVPYVLEYLAPSISTYITLPSASEVWDVFILFGALLALTGFLQNAYSKGHYPWLFGKLGGGLVELGIFYFLFLLLPKSLGSAGVESSGLVSLVVLAIALSYGYLILDFFDARRKMRLLA